MGAYAQTTTIDYRKARKIGIGIGILVGQVDVTNYNSTLAEITEITGRFKDDPRVIMDGLSDNGYIGLWDNTEKAVKAHYAGGAFTGTSEPPRLIVEETVAVSGHTGTLAELPAYILCVTTNANSCHVVPTGKTPLTKQCAVTFTTGVLVFAAGDAVTTVDVTYIPQQEEGPFSAANLVIDEAVVAAAAKTDLAFQAFAVQYVYDTTDGINNVFEPVGEEATATHNCVVDIDDGSSDTNVDSHGDDEGNALVVTYLKRSGLPTDALHIGDTDITLNSEVWDFSSDDVYDDLIIPGFGTHIVGEETAANMDVVLAGPSTSAAEDVAQWNPYKNLLTTNQTGTLTTVSQSWFNFDTRAMQGDTPAGTVGGLAAATEVADDVDVGVINFIAIGQLT